MTAQPAGNPYHGLREMALSLTAEQIGVAATPERPNVWGAMMEIGFAEGSVTLEFKPAADLPDSTFDPEGIHRAVLNVVTNAIDAVEGREQARVQVETGYVPETETIWISVADNGPGIPPEQMKKLFSLFESTKGARGTGLGLAVSQKILREHGGEIAADLLPEGGARFTLAWPHSDEEHQLGGRTLS